MWLFREDRFCIKCIGHCSKRAVKKVKKKKKKFLSKKVGGFLTSGSLPEVLGLEREKAFSHIHFHFLSPLLLIMSGFRNVITLYVLSLSSPLHTFTEAFYQSMAIHLAPSLTVY